MAVAPKLLLAKTYDARLSPEGWWMSEKLDGVRALWNGTNFISRLGNTYYAPPWFTKDLPPYQLDGELWCGRGLFQHTVSIVRKQAPHDGWRQVMYVIFDAPGAKGNFECRLKSMPDGFGNFSRLLHHERCKSRQHLATYLTDIQNRGGEGVMLRMPGSMYETKRSSTLLKVKGFHDAEGVVVDHKPGKGKHKGRLGALIVALPDGRTFDVGTGFTDAQRENPPPVGSTITYRFQELTDGGKPRFPSFIRVRKDK